MPEPHTEVTVNHIPVCDICITEGKEVPSWADTHVPRWGRWAYLCESCFHLYTCSLGLGAGQKLILDKPIDNIAPEIDGS